VAVFPELALSGYSIDDILMQDALLDAVEDELQRITQASVELMPVLVIGAPLRYLHRIYNTAVVIHRGRVLGVAPKSYLPTYREFYELRQMAAGDGICDEICFGRKTPRVRAPIGPDLLFTASDLPGFRFLLRSAKTCGSPSRPALTPPWRAPLCWPTYREAPPPSVEPKTDACWLDRHRCAAPPHTSTRPRAKASRQPTWHGMAT
jgi:NAD+ synthase (glutamine-hydrolysing)